MPQWEYQILQLPKTRDLNSTVSELDGLGRQERELVAVYQVFNDQVRFVFKKRD